MTIETCSSLENFFHNELTTAMRRQKVMVTAGVMRHVAGVLVQYASRTAASLLDHSVVVCLNEALESPASQRGARLQTVGDGVLYLTGMFGDHVAHVQGGVGFYVHAGSMAYAQAAKVGHMSEALSELSEKFPQVVDVLTEVAVAQSLGSVTKSLVQLYDRCKNANSHAAATEMARRGTFPGRGGSA
jgi:hypothetical protein